MWVFCVSPHWNPNNFWKWSNKPKVLNLGSYYLLTWLRSKSQNSLPLCFGLALVSITTTTPLFLTTNIKSIAGFDTRFCLGCKNCQRTPCFPTYCENSIQFNLKFKLKNYLVYKNSVNRCIKSQSFLEKPPLFYPFLFKHPWGLVTQFWTAPFFVDFKDVIYYLLKSWLRY